MKVTFPNPKGTEAERNSISQLVSRYLPQEFSSIPQFEILSCTVKVPEPWIALTLSGTWVNFGGGYESAAAMKHPSGVVEVRGMVKDGTINTTVATLPAGFRPVSTIVVPSWAANLGCRLDIQASGAIVQQDSLAAGTSFLTLRCSFLAQDSSPQVLSCWPIDLKTRLTAPPAGVFVISVKELGADSRSVSRIHVDAVPQWEWVGSSSKPLIRIKNLTGLPYNKQFELKFLVVGFP